jgi:hypothetical protein
VNCLDRSRDSLLSSNRIVCSCHKTRATLQKVVIHIGQDDHGCRPIPSLMAARCGSLSTSDAYLLHLGEEIVWKIGKSIAAKVNERHSQSV